MKRLTWVKWYMTDWMIGVRRMSWAARGIYMEALALQFHGERLEVGLDAWQELFPGLDQADYWQVIRHFEERQDEHGSHFVNRRLEAEIDACKVKSEKARANAKRSHSGRSANAKRTLSGRSAIRGEERREEETREEQSVVGADAPQRARPGDPLIWSPSTGWQGVSDQDRADWAVAYPAVKVDQEMAKAHQWLLARPAKQKKRRWRAFLTSWLNRTQEDGGTRGGRVEPTTAPRQLDRSHIPEDCAPGQDHLFWDGTFPNIPSTYTDTAGNLRHTRTRQIICAAEA